ncbi:MAG: hypothetical protein UHK60_08440 [Acutalibacteraceae bacterium]|nr:hypothetical protein [Acutalibacteraceae bacterium]
MYNNRDNGEKSSAVVGIIAVAIIVAIIVVFFAISANTNGGSPAKPVDAPEAATELVEDDADTSSLSDDTDEEPVEEEKDEPTEVEEEPTEAETEEEPTEEEPTEAETEEEPTEAETEETEEGIVECPNCNKMVAKLERFKPSEDYLFFKLWCADCRAEVEDGEVEVEDIDFESDVECDGCNETFEKPSAKNSIQNNGLCDDCYQSYKKTMEENGVEVL